MMKIYNKKGFWTGVFYLLLTVCFLCLFYYKGLNFLDILFCAGGIFFGIYYIYRSLSPNLSEADQDERVKLVTQKSRSTAFTWCQVIFVVLGLLGLALFRLTKSDVHMAMFVIFLFAYLIMVIVGGISEFYYDNKF